MEQNYKIGIMKDKVKERTEEYMIHGEFEIQDLLPSEYILEVLEVIRVEACIKIIFELQGNHDVCMI